MEEVPLDEYALDFLDDIHPDAKRLINQILGAAVDHADVHANALHVTRTRDNGFDYFLGLHGGGTSPIVNHQKLPVYLVDPLLHHKILGPKINPQWTSGTYSLPKVPLHGTAPLAVQTTMKFAEGLVDTSTGILGPSHHYTLLKM